jgi:hypothetical protein
MSQGSQSPRRKRGRPKEAETEPITVRLPPDLMAKARVVAATKNVSTSKLIAAAVWDFLKDVRLPRPPRSVERLDVDTTLKKLNLD